MLLCGARPFVIIAGFGLLRIRARRTSVFFRGWMKSMEIVIEVEEWKPKIDEEGKPTGILNYVKQRTLKQVESQLRTVLQAINIEGWDCDAFGGCEWINTNRNLLEGGIFPKGEPLVLFREGSNEGYLLQVVCHNLDLGEMVPVFSVKYLSDEESVWSIVKIVSRAFRNAY